MTAPLPPNADEIASAYLDGEATPDEAALVTDSPELMDRVARLAAIAEAGSAIAPVDAGRKEVHLSAALAEFDRMSEEVTPVAPGDATAPVATTQPGDTARSTGETVFAEVAPVTSIEEVRQRRRGRRLPLVAAAAAAVALLFAAVVAFGLNPASDDSATQASDFADAATGDAGGEDGAEALEPAGPQDMAEAVDAMADDAVAEQAMTDSAMADSAMTDSAVTDSAVTGEAMAVASDDAEDSTELETTERFSDNDDDGSSASEAAEAPAAMVDEADDADQAADVANDEDDDGQAGDETADGAGGSVDTADTGVADLGRFADTSELIEAAETLLSEVDAATATAEPDTARSACSAFVDSEAAPSMLVATATVTEANNLDIDVEVHTTTTAAASLVVLDVATCEQIDSSTR